MSNESKFPTIRDVRDRLSELVEQGLGDLPVQFLVASDSTMQAIAIATGGPDYNMHKPALMIELEPTADRLPVALISTERLSGGSGGMKTTEMQ